MDSPGLIFVIAAASGTGKTTLVRKLLEVNPNIHLSISHTTRTPRAGEIDGQHYFFTTVSDFEDRIAKREFLEYAKVYDRYYGTSQKWLEETLAKGWDVLLEIDVQGAQQVRQKLPQAISIFLLPPNLAELETRLTTRNTDSPDNVALRLQEAAAEIGQASDFDYIVINDDINQALSDLNHIIHSAHLTKNQQLPFLQKLLAK